MVILAQSSNGPFLSTCSTQLAHKTCIWFMIKSKFLSHIGTREKAFT